MSEGERTGAPGESAGVRRRSTQLLGDVCPGAPRLSVAQLSYAYSGADHRRLSVRLLSGSIERLPATCFIPEDYRPVPATQIFPTSDKDGAPAFLEGRDSRINTNNEWSWVVLVPFVHGYSSGVSLGESEELLRTQRIMPEQHVEKENRVCAFCPVSVKQIDTRSDLQKESPRSEDEVEKHESLDACGLYQDRRSSSKFSAVNGRCRKERPIRFRQHKGRKSFGCP